MPIYEVTSTQLNKLEETSFSSENIAERQDLQKLIKADISVLSDDLFVIAEEFCHWEDSKRRIDLLCIDADANIVVVELKRTDDGGHMELQAIRYAAMVSKMTFDNLVSIYAQEKNLSKDYAKQAIFNFLKWETEQEFGSETKIILASAGFSTEITTSVMWLNEQGLDIRCLRLKPYKTSDARIMLDVQQIIPLPEASQYQTQIKAKQQAEKTIDAEVQMRRYQFWEKLLEAASKITDLHANRKPSKYSYIGGSIGKSGFYLNYAYRGENTQIELYIDVKDQAKNALLFNQLKQNKEIIEKEFGGGLLWEDLPNRRACRISYIVSGGYNSPQSEWEAIQNNLVNSMKKFNEAIRPFVNKLSV